MSPQFEQMHLRELFALRYQVYCVERGFLSKDEYPEGEESDIFDSNAAHFAAIDRTGKVLGSVRLVRHTPGFGFPYQSHCQDLFPSAKKLPIKNAVEISRLVVSRTNLRHQEDEDDDFIDASHPPSLMIEGRSSSRCEWIVLGLYKAMYQYSVEMGITHWYAAMERSLVRLLKKYGVNFSPIGATADYFGQVTPCFVTISNLQESVPRLSERLADWFRDPEPNIGNGIRVVQLKTGPHRSTDTSVLVCRMA